MSPSLTLMKTLRYCCCIILISALVSSLGILEAGQDVERRILIQPVPRSDLVKEDGSMRSTWSSQSQIFNQGTLRTLKRSSPMDDYGNRKISDHEEMEILRSMCNCQNQPSSQPPWSLHSYGILRSLRSLPAVDE